MYAAMNNDDNYACAQKTFSEYDSDVGRVAPVGFSRKQLVNAKIEKKKKPHYN